MTHLSLLVEGGPRDNTEKQEKPNREDTPLAKKKHAVPVVALHCNRRQETASTGNQQAICMPTNPPRIHRAPRRTKLCIATDAKQRQRQRHTRRFHLYKSTLIKPRPAFSPAPNKSYASRQEPNIISVELLYRNRRKKQQARKND